MATPQLATDAPSNVATGPGHAAGNGPRTYLVAIVLLVAVIAVGTAAVGIIDAQKAKSEVTALRAQVTGSLRAQAVLGTKLAALSSQVAVVPGQAALARVQSQLTKDEGQIATFTNCIPELQTELSGLSISWSYDPSGNTTDYWNLTNNSQISHDCSAVLYGG